MHCYVKYTKGSRLSLDWSKSDKVTFLSLPSTPKRVQKPNAQLFDCSSFAIFLEALVKVDLVVLEISAAKKDSHKSQSSLCYRALWLIRLIKLQHILQIHRLDLRSMCLVYDVVVWQLQTKEAKFRHDWLDRQRANERRRMMLLEREKMRQRAVAREQADEAVRLDRERERLR